MTRTVLLVSQCYSEISDCLLEKLAEVKKHDYFFLDLKSIFILPDTRDPGVLLFKKFSSKWRIEM